MRIIPAVAALAPLVATLGLATFATPAAASVTTFGGGWARECYLAAAQKRETRAAIAVCGHALAAEALSRRDRAATLVNRGIVHMQARDLDKAMGNYEDALRIDPELAEAHVNLGIALLHRGGKDRDAIGALTRGLAMNPTRPEVALYTRAVAHEMVGQVREAYDDYKAAAALKPDWKDPVEQLKRFSVERRETARG